jgi:hypothetical protein
LNSGFTVPDDLPNGVYSVVFEDGAWKHEMLLNDTDVEIHKVEKRATYPFTGTKCSGYSLPTGDTDKAKAILDAQCNRSVGGGLSFYSISGDVVSWVAFPVPLRAFGDAGGYTTCVLSLFLTYFLCRYVCNTMTWLIACDVGAHRAANSEITRACGLYKGGYTTYGVSRGGINVLQLAYGYEYEGTKFCPRS